MFLQVLDFQICTVHEILEMNVNFIFETVHTVWGDNIQRKIVPVWNYSVGKKFLVLEGVNIIFGQFVGMAPSVGDIWQSQKRFGGCRVIDVMSDLKSFNQIPPQPPVLQTREF